jgi:uncharacterized membrane protein
VKLAPALLEFKKLRGAADGREGEGRPVRIAEPVARKKQEETVMAESRVSVAKHPIHPMLVVVPLGLWVAALAFDIAAAFTMNGMWRTLAFWNIIGGIVGALVAAVPGFLDYLTMQGRVGRIATWHMILNLAAVAVFALNAFVRTRVGMESAWPLTLTVIGVVEVFVAGWLGGEMVYVERVGVVEPREAREGRPRRAA